MVLSKPLIMVVTIVIAPRGYDKADCYCPVGVAQQALDGDNI